MADANKPKKPRRDRWRELVEASREQETSSTNEANRTDKSRHPRDTGKRERQVTFADLPLFASERDIANALMGPGRYSTWRAIAPLLERRGLPTIDGLMGGRYTPAIRAFFDREYGIHGQAAMCHRPVDGPERLGSYQGRARRRKPKQDGPAT